MQGKIKIALITGASRGLGENTALALAKQGVGVIVTYHSNEAEAKAVVSAIATLGSQAVALQLDTANTKTFDRFVVQVKQSLQDIWQTDRFDFLINNAGMGIYAPFAETTEEQFDLLNFKSTIATQNTFYAAIGDAKVSVIDVRDIADVAVTALTEMEHEGKVYDLTGPQALTHTEMAQFLSAAIGRPITFVDIPPDAMHDALLSVGFPSWQAEGLIEDYAHYQRGEASAITAGVQDATGQAPRSFETFAQDYAPMFNH